MADRTVRLRLEFAKEAHGQVTRYVVARCSQLLTRVLCSLRYMGNYIHSYYRVRPRRLNIVGSALLAPVESNICVLAREIVNCFSQNYHLILSSDEGCCCCDVVSLACRNFELGKLKTCVIFTHTVV